MATDPVQRIERSRRESALESNLPRLLQRLAALPPSPEEPYLTVAIDWRPEGNRPNQRSGRAQAERELAALAAEHGPRGATFDILSAAQEELAAFLDGELDPAAQGVVVVAGGPGRVFEPVALALPVTNELVLAPIPHLSTLARIAEDHPTFCVVLADQQDATVWFVNQAVPIRTVEVDATQFPRKQMQGGWSQRRYQLRAEERIESFAGTVAEEIRKGMDATGAEALIIAGDEVITPVLEGQLHQTVAEKIRGHVRLDVTASEAEVLAAALPVALAAERERELDAARKVAEFTGSGGAASGAEDVLVGLQAGQVQTLVIAEDFDAPGWADYTLPVMGAGAPPAVHPAGGDPSAIVPVPLKDELVRLAFATGADVEIVSSVVPAEEVAAEGIPDAGTPAPRTEAAQILDAAGGVGAIFRFVMTPADPELSNTNG